MEIYCVTFIGHREIFRMWQNVSENLRQLIRVLLTEKEYVNFYVGRNGDFDEMVAEVIKQVRAELGKENCRLILVQPYPTKMDEYYKTRYDIVCYPLSIKTHYKAAIEKRNRWMIDKADAVIAYENKGEGNTFLLLRYSRGKRKKIINLARLKRE